MPCMINLPRKGKERKGTSKREWDVGFRGAVAKAIILRSFDVVDIFPSFARSSAVWVVVTICSHGADT